MLYLSRKTGESIIINNEIELIIKKISKNKVDIGFQFPPHASILRKELYDKIKQENLKSSEELTETLPSLYTIESEK